MKEWVKDVFIFEHSDAQLGDDHFEQEKKASDTAIEGLFSLFCDRDECQDSDLIKEFLSTSKSEDDERTISTLAGWTEELLSSLEAVSGKVFISGITPQDIQAQIRRYTRHQKSRDINGRLVPSPWPFVAVARYSSPPALSFLFLLL